MTYLLIALAVIALAFLVGYIADRVERARFIAMLPPIEREELRGFELVNRWWRHPHYQTVKRWHYSDLVTPWHSPREMN